MKNFFLDNLPDEVLLNIINFSNLNTAEKLASVSKKWQCLTSDDLVWKQRIFNEPKGV